MAVQQITNQQQTLWAELRRLVAQTPLPAGAASGSLGRDSLTLGATSPENLFALPAKGALAIGDSGNEVARLQQALRLLGYYREASNTAAFGWVTSEAVKAFQRDRGLSAAGTVDAATRQAIADALAGKGGTTSPVVTSPAGTSWQAPTSSGWTAPTSGSWMPPTAGSPSAPPSAPPAPQLPARPVAKPAEATPPANRAFNWYGNADPRNYFISQIYDPR